MFSERVQCRLHDRLALTMPRLVNCGPERRTTPLLGDDNNFTTSRGRGALTPASLVAQARCTDTESGPHRFNPVGI